MKGMVSEAKGQMVLLPERCTETRLITSLLFYLGFFLFVYSSFSLQSSIHLTIGVLKIQVLVLPIHIQIETYTSTQHSFQCKSLKSFVVGLGAFFFLSV